MLQIRSLVILPSFMSLCSLFTGHDDVSHTAFLLNPGSGWLFPFHWDLVFWISFCVQLQSIFSLVHFGPVSPSLLKNLLFLCWIRRWYCSSYQYFTDWHQKHHNFVPLTEGVIHSSDISSLLKPSLLDSSFPFKRSLMLFLLVCLHV